MTVTPPACCGKAMNYVPEQNAYVCDCGSKVEGAFWRGLWRPRKKP